MTLATRLGHGLLAGAAGTMALDATTYADMLLRGRPASQLPGEGAVRVAKRAGVDLQGDDEPTRARREGLGTLLGYATGAAVCVAAAFVLGDRAGRSVVAHGLTLGASAMLASMLPMAAEGLSDPREWGLEGWLEDIVPHAAYGLAAAAALRALSAAR
ncbi:MAG: hypothetical protein LC792_13385 [Actinobacteria bacterium]|nr:hypothetical protein [Actinomycetota bacterium]